MFVYLAVYFFLNILYRTILVEEGWEAYRYTFESLKGAYKITLHVSLNEALVYIELKFLLHINKIDGA